MKYILTADWHLTDKAPICRTDEDYLQTTLSKIKEIYELAKEYSATILVAGDIFDKWSASCYVVNELIKLSRRYDVQCFMIPGQHDLPYHNYDMIHKSAYSLLTEYHNMEDALEYTCLSDLTAYNYDSITTEIRLNHIGMFHFLTYKDEKPFPDFMGKSSKAILKKKWEDHRLLLVGDNHQTFVDDYKGTYLVSPGSLTRRAIDQKDHKPSVFIYDSETKYLEQYYLSIEKRYVSSVFAEEKKEVSERYEAFVKSLNKDVVDISFEKNIENSMAKNKVEEPVKRIIKNAMEAM